jgi:hypothetical protein
MNTEETRFQRWIAYRIPKGIAVLGCCLSVLLTIAIGFFWGGWTTHGHAVQMVDKAASQARIDLASKVCVAQFLGQKDAAAKLHSLKDTAFWIRGQVIDKGGWDKLPGQAETIEGVNDACAQSLAEMPAPKNSQVSDNGPAKSAESPTVE